MNTPLEYLAIKELQREEYKKYLELSILWRSSIMNQTEDKAFNEHRNILNTLLGKYLDEFMPERKVERRKAVKDSQTTLDRLVRKKSFKLKTQPPKQKPRRGQRMKNAR